MRKHMLLAFAFTFLGLAACAKKETPQATTVAPTAKPADSNVVPVQELQVQADDVTLYARVAGNLQAGNVLIAVNGGPGLSSHYMYSLEELASQEFAVVTYDQRGTGRSTTPSSGYGWSDYVADLDAVRQAVGVQEFHILGHSWGGQVAMQYTTVYPQRIKSIILVGSGPPYWQAERAAQASMLQRIQELQERDIIANPLPTGAAQMEAILPAYFSDPNFKLPGAGQETQFNPTTSQYTLAARGDYDLTSSVARIKQRVLMLWGQDDPFGLPMAESSREALSAAQVEWVLLEGCGHFWDECPDQFFSHARAFLGLPPANQ